MKIRYYYILLLLSLTSCFQEDTPIKSVLNPDGNIVEIEIGEDYANQVFFDLGIGDAISTNKYSTWNLAFSSLPEESYVWLNTAKVMGIQKIKNREFNEVITLSELRQDPQKFKVDLAFDVPSGHGDSTAFGRWWLDKDCFYIVHLGYDEYGKDLGYKKLRFLSADLLTFQFEHCDLNNSNLRKEVIDKKGEYGKIAFSFDNGVVDIFPKIFDWDLCFTRYTFIFDTLGIKNFEYSVVGVLNNFPFVQSKKIYNVDYDDVDYNFANNLQLSIRQDEIGYDWKTISSAWEYYTIEENIVYIVRDADGILYKLRFIDFYDKAGRKGYPNFEYKKL